MLRHAIVYVALLFAVPAWAIPPFDEVFKKTYEAQGWPLKKRVAELK